MFFVNSVKSRRVWLMNKIGKHSLTEGICVCFFASLTSLSFGVLAIGLWSHGLYIMRHELVSEYTMNIFFYYPSLGFNFLLGPDRFLPKPGGTRRINSKNDLFWSKSFSSQLV